MPDLHQILRNTDQDFLERIARHWGIELPASSFNDDLNTLEAGMKNKELAAEIINAMPEEARQAWNALLQSNGLMTSVQFSRLFGEIRVLGEARRKREQPDLSPVSPAEILFYRGLVGRSFLNLPPEPQEYTYIPQEFLNFFLPMTQKVSREFIRPATDFEYRFPVSSGDLILDRITLLLCEIRKGNQDLSVLTGNPLFSAFCIRLIDSLGLFDDPHNLNPEKVKEFLEIPRGRALQACFKHWLEDARMNDLRMLPGLEFDGTWMNDPLSVKQLLLKTLSSLDSSTWWSLSGLITAFKENLPDFQRPAGDYDSWFVRKAGTEEYLRGFEHWDEIDGALLRHLVTGPLFWLGFVDIGLAEKKGQPTAFRLTLRSKALISGEEIRETERKEEPIIVTANGIIRLPHSVSRVSRYQIGRFGQLTGDTSGETVYKITASSLRSAEEQGLRASQLLTLLRHAPVKSTPSSVVQMLERWDKFGPEVKVERTILLRVSRPEILSGLQQHPQASRLIKESLTPLIAEIKPGSEEAIVKILSELGYITDCELIV